jgi:hypothetical protein
MREFSKVSPAVWQSKRFTSLPSDDGRFLYIYMLTSSHQTSAGCYCLPEGYACSDLGWEPKRYRAARKQLIDADLIHFDDETDFVMITRWFKHNPPTSESHLIGIERLLERIPSDSLRDAAHEGLREAWQSIGAAKVAKAQRKQKPAYGLPNGPSGAVSDRLLNTSQMQRLRRG